MESLLIILLVAALAVVGGFVVGLILQRRQGADRVTQSEQDAKKVLEQAQQEAERVVLKSQKDAKTAVATARQEFEKTTKSRRDELVKQERRLSQREENLDKKADQLEKAEQEQKRLEKNLSRQEELVQKTLKEHGELVEEAKKQLEIVAGMSPEEAKQKLIEAMKDEARVEAAKHIRQIEDEARQEADHKAKEAIALALQRYAGEFVAEKTVSVVDLPNDDMKGRIIGREGRNIRALEAATGIDLIIDDTPEAVIISGFNPFRREVAKLAIEKLVADGRIHPARIEEVVEKTRKEVEQEIRNVGEQAAFDLQLHGLHPELIKLVGKLKYHSVGGQNLYQHSIEVAFLCGLLASELGMNVKPARRAGLLHDIGHAVDHEMEGSHASVGAEMAKRHGESQKIVQAIRAHHDEEPPQSALAVILQAANQLSIQRPGARHEVLETYIKRLEDVEKLAADFKGVQKVFAIQAGREIRVIVDNASVSDDEAVMLSRDIAKKIESEMVYPGQIRVSVIRETRAVEFAK